MKRIFVLLLLLRIATAAGAQTPTPPKPSPTPAPPPSVLSGTLLNRAPVFAAWEISVAQTNASVESSASEKPKFAHGKASPAPTVKAASAKTTPDRVLSITKTADVVLVESPNANGSEAEEWHKAEAQVITRPEWHEPLISLGGNPSDMAYTDYTGSDFPGLRWVSRKNFAGLEQKDGHICLVFKDKVLSSSSGRETALTALKPAAQPAPPEEESEAVPVEADIDYYSRLPVSSRRGNEVFSYRFKDPPQAMQVFPPNLQALIDTRRGEIKAQLQAPAPP